MNFIELANLLLGNGGARDGVRVDLPWRNTYACFAFDQTAIEVYLVSTKILTLSSHGYATLGSCGQDTTFTALKRINRLIAPYQYRILVRNGIYVLLNERNGLTSHVVPDMRFHLTIDTENGVKS